MPREELTELARNFAQAHFPAHSGHSDATPPLQQGQGRSSSSAAAAAGSYPASHHHHHHESHHPTNTSFAYRAERALIERGQRALAAIHAANSAAQNASALAVNMAQESNLASNLANQAQALLERYVYGKPVSAVPVNVAPEPPALYSPPREVLNRGFTENHLINLAAFTATNATTATSQGGKDEEEEEGENKKKSIRDFL